MNVLKLWNDKREGDGDVELRVNGSVTYAHWCMLKEVPYFRALQKSQLTHDRTPHSLEIEDSSITLNSLISAMKYIYLDHCFTQELDSHQLRNFCQFLQSQTLQLDSFNIVVDFITESNCLDCYRLGKAFNLVPLKRKAWKQAVINNWTEQVRDMISFGAEINSEITREKQTALHISLERGYLNQALLLIESGADIERQDYQGKSALGISAWYGYTELVQVLLERGADLRSADQWSQTALHKVCGLGMNDLVQILLKYGADVNLTSRDGYTALHIAAIGGHRDVVLTLLDHGAEWKLGDIQWRRTALHMAAMKGHADLVRILVQLHGDQLKHDAGRGCLTPLHVALERGYNEVAKILIEHNAPLNCQDWEGHTPLHYAAKSGNAEAAVMLLDAGARLYKQDKKNMTCLHLAAARNHISVVSILLARKDCPLNVVDSDGLTALHHAAGNGNSKVVRQLLQAGVVPSILSKDGYIARNLAGKKGHISTLRFLIMAQS